MTKHLSANDYYEKNHRVVGRWYGFACKRFGTIAGTDVREGEFAALCNNSHAITGAQLTERNNSIRKDGNSLVNNRRNFYDFTFSAPKSFSIMALTMNDDRIKEWHNRAVIQALKEMEKHTARQDHKNKGVEVTGKLCAAIYKHDCNRSLEPQLHDHVIVFNATPSENGKNYAIESNEFFQRCGYFTAIYRNELANAAIAGGYDIEFDQYNAPQIVGMAEVCKHFSARSKDIEMLIEQAEDYLGTSLSRNEKKQITYASRGFDFTKFQRYWNAHPKSGFSRIDHLKRFVNAVRKSSDNSLVEITTPEVLDLQWNGLEPRQQSTLKVIKGKNSEQAQGKIKGQTLTLQEALSFSRNHHFERNSVLKDYKFCETTINALCGTGFSFSQIENDIHKFYRENQIVKVDSEIAPIEHWTQEAFIIDAISEGKGKFKSNQQSPVVSDKLSLEQRDAVMNILQSQDQICALVGKAGTGKTFSLSEVVRKHVEADLNVILCAPSNGARDVLHQDGNELYRKYNQPGTAAPFQNAVSLQKLLIDSRKGNTIESGSMIILDEASLASTRQIHDLIKIVQDRDCRLLLTGDPSQHSAVEAGDAFRMLLKFSEIEKQSIKKIVRQKDLKYREVAKALSAGEISTAINLLEQQQCITEARSTNRYNLMVKEYFNAIDSGKSAIVVNPTHRENDLVAEKIRTELKRQNIISAEKSVTCLKPLNWTKAQKTIFRNYKPGIIIIDKHHHKYRFQRAIHGKGLLLKDPDNQDILFGKERLKDCNIFTEKTLFLGIGDKIMIRENEHHSEGKFTNGEVITIKNFDKSENIVAEDGRVLKSKQISYGYAATSHKSQGATFESVIIGFDRHSVLHADKKLAYVAGTRGTESIKIFCENKLDLYEIDKRSGDRKSVMELLHSKPVARLEKLRSAIDKSKQKTIAELPFSRTIEKSISRN
ncbi:MAG: relaxase domain-containing protein [Victivallales bacterium]|nr:relaxase domain-containing protein [Victivallales bacterium]